MTLRTPLLSALVLALGGIATSASATVDQQNSSAVLAVRNIGTTTPTVSQSFANTSGVINYATFSLYATSTLVASATDTASYSVLLLQGDGITGAVLAQSDTQTLAFQMNQASLTALPVTFDFATDIALTVGAMYTLELVDVGSTAPFKLGVAVSTGNQYTSGSWYSGQDPSATNSTNGVDLIFSEGSAPRVSAVPEPANAALLMAGLGFMGLVARRRKTLN